MPATMDPVPVKAKKKIPVVKEDAPKRPTPIPLSACSHGPAINVLRHNGLDLPKQDFASVVPDDDLPGSARSISVLEAAPTELAELPAYFLALTDGQLRRGWKPCLINGLVEELESRGVLLKDTTRGVIRHFMLACEVVHARLIRIEPLTETEKRIAPVYFESLPKGKIARK